MPNDVLLAPSILSADYAVLADQVALVHAESDWLHVDLMDGHFVPNLSIGPPVVASLRRHTDLFLDCHLMVTDPGFWLEQLAELYDATPAPVNVAFRLNVAAARSNAPRGARQDARVEAGANLCSVHVELGDPTPLLVRVRELGMKAGVVIDGPTPFETVEPYLDDRIDLLLVMTIKAGFGGQAFVPEHLEKVRRARERRDARGLDYRIQVDGGINPETARDAATAGADVLVAGSAIFWAPDPPEAARAIREAAAST